jgi:hypothetical protein
MKNTVYIKKLKYILFTIPKNNKQITRNCKKQHKTYTMGSSNSKSSTSKSSATHTSTTEATVVPINNIREVNGFRIVNIQNLDRKDEIIDEKSKMFNSRAPIDQLLKANILVKNYDLKEEDVYYYVDTVPETKCAELDEHGKSCPVEQTFEVNNFIGSFLNAYNTHSDVVLNPDDFWIMICLFFSNYVDSNAEALRSKFVAHDGQESLVVVELAGDTETSLKMEKQWDYFYEQIYSQLKTNTKDGIVDALVCDFSTSGPVQKIISTSVIMNSFKQYFSFGRMIMCCGINNVYFQGTRDDWVKLIEKTKNLAQYDVDSKLIKYTDSVVKILTQFLNTWDGRVDLKFWNQILATEEKRIGSGGQVQTMIEGWILHFFGKYERMDLDDVPDYSISVPVKMENKITNTTKNLNIVANWLSVSKLDRYLYKSDLGLAIVEVERSEEPKYFAHF